jgi:predicted CXXCH cytochrome family protein
MSADAPTEGRRRVDPGSIVTVYLAARVLDDARDVLIVASIPTGWTIAESGGGSFDPYGGTVAWLEGDLEAGTLVRESFRLRAPGRSLDGRAAFDVQLEARLEHADGVIDTARTRLRVAPVLVVDHVTFGVIETAGMEPAYRAADAPLEGVVAFDTFRIRFQVRNADLVRTGLVAGLQYREAGAFWWLPLATDRPDLGLPFRLYTEWRRTGNGSDTRPGPEAETIEPGELRERDTDDETQQPEAGRRLMGAPDARTFPIAGDSYTEVEFTVRATIDVAYAQAYEFRLVDAGLPIVGAAVADVRTAAHEPSDPSPGQRNGIPVGPPVDAGRGPSGGLGAVDYPLLPPGVVAAAWPESGGITTYRLAYWQPAAPSEPSALNAPFTSAHTPDTSLVSDTCAICHRAHVAQGGVLLTSASPQSALCFTCHDGTGSNLNTKAQFTDVAVPANDAANRSYYRHDATAATTHTLAQDNEFGGVSNRHSECGDCHNPHNATAAVSTHTTTGWTVPGQLTTVSGVAVANGGAGAAPTYTFKDGTAGNQPTREYEVCLKCHSGFTVLPSNASLLTPTNPAYPAYSKYALDKGVEFNLNNASFHPVESAGTNPNTTIMNNNLAGTSPSKQWNFTSTSTIRCVNCHGDPRKYNATLPNAGGAATLAGSDMAPHTSPNRGILMQNYKDRVLRTNSEAYAAADFALCFMCHAEGPFTSSGSTLTRFSDHYLHVGSGELASKGTAGTYIDQPGVGNGRAICAECHFRIHGTALAYNVGDRTNARLVNFAPNVTASGGVIEFVARDGATPGSCTLTCHGKEHNGFDY